MVSPSENICRDGWRKFDDCTIYMSDRVQFASVVRRVAEMRTDDKETNQKIWTGVGHHVVILRSVMSGIPTKGGSIKLSRSTVSSELSLEEL